MVPETVPDVSKVYKSWSKLKFHELAFEVASLYCSTDEVPAEDLRGLMQRSYKTFDHNEVVPSIKVNDLWVMELFHGPTFAFKELFADLDFKKQYGLGAVNSINWARIMFQITYYFSTYFKLFPGLDGEISFSVPTGNFGDILAGYYAKRMGLPIKNLIVATNSNDILHRFFTQGKYDKYPVKQTMSPSMDIGISSNFERYLYDLFDHDATRLSKAMQDFKTTGKLHVEGEELKRAQKDFVSACATEKHQADTIRQYQDKFNYTLCPHTACGISAAEQLRGSLKWASLRNHAMVVLGTAHPGKFADNVIETTGVQVKLPPALDQLMTAKTRYQVLNNSSEEVRRAIESNVQGFRLLPSSLWSLIRKLQCCALR